MRRRASPGYTLAELLMVVAILSIVAVIALPAAQLVTEAGADAALDEVALALRFARDDARRSGEPRLVGCDQNAGTLTVGAVDSDKDNSFPSSRTILRPGTNLPYVVAPGAAPAGTAMTLASCSFTFADNASAATVVFDAAGKPVRGIGKGPARDQALRAGSIVLGAGTVRRTMNLAVTGRLTRS